MSNVFIAFQANEESRPLVDAVKIDAPNRLVVKRETIEEIIGRKYDLQELQINLVTLSGNLDEDDDEFVLSWKH